MKPPIVLAPLRGVTVRCFRETFAREIESAGFTEAVTPFVSAMPGVDPMNDRELRGAPPGGFLVTPQFIGKDPQVLRGCLERVKAAGYATADLNCGCPFPMVRNKGRGSGLLGSPDLLAKMLEAGCETMGPGAFSVKARLGLRDAGELMSLMPLLNSFPLRFLTVHGRVATQMYDGECDVGAVAEVCAASANPVVLNGDVAFPAPETPPVPGAAAVMIGRSFVRHLGTRDDARELLARYAGASLAELGGCERAALGRMKELVAYWKDLSRWRGRWRFMKLARTLSEFLA